MQAVDDNMQGVASDPIIFTVAVGVQVKAPSAEPLSLPVNKEAMVAVGHDTKSRSKDNRLPTLT